MTDILKDVTREQFLEWAVGHEKSAAHFAKYLLKFPKDTAFVRGRRDHLAKAAIYRGLVRLYDDGRAVERGHWFHSDGELRCALVPHPVSESTPWAALPSSDET